MGKLSYISIDITTGGQDEKIHSLLGIQMYTVIEDEIKSIREILIKDNPYVVTAEAMKTNGIDIIKHDAKAISKEEAANSFLHFAVGFHGDLHLYKLTHAYDLPSRLSDAERDLIRRESDNTKPIPMGYNIQFKIRFLKKLLESINEKWDKYFSDNYIDLSTLCQTLYGTNVIDVNPKNEEELWQYLNVMPYNKIKSNNINGAEYNIMLYNAIKNKVEENFTKSKKK